MTIQAVKNAIYYLSFPAYDSATPTSLKTGVSPVDTAYYKDGAGSWTTLAIADTASELGSTGMYEIDLTAAEMNHDQVIIKFAVSGMSDAFVAFDLKPNIESQVWDALIASHQTTSSVGLTMASIFAQTTAIEAYGLDTLIGNLNDVSVADIVTTSLTESYSALGAEPTLTQAVYLILQQLYEKDVTGATVTVKKLDGSTTAATGTLNDATAPTSVTRAT